MAFVVVVREFKIQTHADAAGLHLRALVQRHRGGVVVDARDVGAVDADAGVGAAEGERGLFGELEARGVGGAGDGGERGRDGGGEFDVLHGFFVR